MRNFYNDYSNNTVTLMDRDTGLEVGAELTLAEKPLPTMKDVVAKHGMTEARPKTNIAGQTKSSQPGDMWSNEFDYIGMLKMGMGRAH